MNHEHRFGFLSFLRVCIHPITTTYQWHRQTILLDFPTWDVYYDFSWKDVCWSLICSCISSWILYLDQPWHPPPISSPNRQQQNLWDSGGCLIVEKKESRDYTHMVPISTCRRWKFLPAFHEQYTSVAYFSRPFFRYLETQLEFRLIFLTVCKPRTGRFRFADATPIQRTINLWLVKAEHDFYHKLPLAWDIL